MQKNTETSHLAASQWAEYSAEVLSYPACTLVALAIAFACKQGLCMTDGVQAIAKAESIRLGAMLIEGKKTGEAPKHQRRAPGTAGAGGAQAGYGQMRVMARALAAIESSF